VGAALVDQRHHRDRAEPVLVAVLDLPAIHPLDQPGRRVGRVEGRPVRSGRAGVVAVEPRGRGDPSLPVGPLVDHLHRGLDRDHRHLGLVAGAHAVVAAAEDHRVDARHRGLAVEVVGLPDPPELIVGVGLAREPEPGDCAPLGDRVDVRPGPAHDGGELAQVVRDRDAELLEVLLALVVGVQLTEAEPAAAAVVDVAPHAPGQPAAEPVEDRPLVICQRHERSSLLSGTRTRWDQPRRRRASPLRARPRRPRAPGRWSPRRRSSGGGPASRAGSAGRCGS
jgi:hypothetical protein